MTAQELETKLKDSQERVNKRLNTLSKLCKREGYDYDNIIKKYREIVKSYEPYYLTREQREQITEISEVADNLYKLYELERIMVNWQIKLDKEKNRDNIEKIPAIWNFLCDWEIKCIEWYKQNCELYYQLKLEEKEKFQKYKEEHPERFMGRSNYWEEQRWSQNYYNNVDSFTREITKWDREYFDISRFEREYRIVGYHIDEELLKKEVAKEKKNKYFDLVNRITKVVGTIVDASNLSVGNQRGELNGIVSGIHGKARIETISAGGYNIQKFHYRVLVHEIK